MATKDPYDEREATKDFYRILDEIFGAFDRNQNNNIEGWRENANKWFVDELRRFSEDVEELMTRMPDIIRDDPSLSLDPGADMVMDAWIDGRHYEIVVSRLTGEDAQPEPSYEPELRMSVDAIDADDFRFDEQFTKEWA